MFSWLFVAACAGDDNIGCWADVYTTERCCTSAPGGNPECWTGTYSYDLCCANYANLDACSTPDFQSFKVAAAQWYAYPVMDSELFLHIVSILAEFEMLLDVCAPAALVAYLLHLEQNYFCSEQYWGAYLGRYVASLQQAIEKKLLFPSHFVNGWALNAGLQRLLELRARAHDATVDLVVCYCREDLIWLQALRGERNPLIPESSDPFYDKPDMDYADALRRRVNLRIYHKCPPNTDEMNEESAALIKRWASSFRDVRVRYVFDEVRADECSGYMAYLHDSYDELPEYTFFLHADAIEHIPQFYFLGATVLAASKGLLNNGFVHLGSHYVLPDFVLEQEEFGNVWRSIFHSSIAPKLSAVLAYCCAQFMVSRKQIQIRPKSFYTAAWTYFASKASYYDLFRPIKHVRTLDTINRKPCVFLEYMWHVIFGEEFMNPRRHEDPRVPLFMQTNNLDANELLTNKPLIQ
eukprot:GEMP01055638.1.p1 GENE.GEMP01055638.1~~GEMP01055638.1.p1  ORF type:complete len:465 (+),score=62.71 GEMP01055638.1:104-1498(+)